MDLSTNTIFMHILAQEGQANIIKAVNHGKKQGDMLAKLIKHARKQEKEKIYYEKQIDML